MKKKIFFLFILSFPFFALAQDNGNLSDRAPTDQPVKFTGEEKLKAFDQEIEPYVKQAHKTLAKAKKRFQKGLPKGDIFFVTVRIFDNDGKFEQVFIRVKEWEGDKISGYIANDLSTVKEFRSGQLIAFKEKSVMDWTISKPDGSEEGNYVGKYLDTRQ